ncbi:hypothetical protein LVD17_17210 [Fulvivirga ulvae]|uniref:hypothetical protein n=1 Tax=Fulvivirga ulvae TaxID=2904245 RepID=UPI001F3CA037|nr:hypothetical protein [Fulvivirga ulvae]UII30040.1 hypothetical protein LVD17_17210 [Fulvivirga ulvae]
MPKRSQQIFLWILILLLCFQFIVSGAMRLSGKYADLVIWGYSCSLVSFVGLLDIFIAICLLFSKVRLVSAFILILSMLWQGYIYLMHQELAFVMIDLASAGLALIVVWYSRESLYAQGKW